MTKRTAEASAGPEVPEQVQDVDPGRGIEHADDLVGDEDSGSFEEQRARHEHALELPARELVRVLPEHRVRVETDSRGAAACTLGLAIPSSGRPGRTRLPVDVEDPVGLEDRVVGAEGVILEDALHRAAVGLQYAAPSRWATSWPSWRGMAAAAHRCKAQDHAADRGLAAAALADERDDLPRVAPRRRRPLTACKTCRIRRCRPGRPCGRPRGTGARRPSAYLPARHPVATLKSSTNGGWARRCSSASGQRARNRQPSGAGRGATVAAPGCPARRRSANRTPTSGSDEMSRPRVGMPRAAAMMGAAVGAFSARWPAYMTRIVSATSWRMARSVRDSDLDRPDEAVVPQAHERLGDGLLGRDVEGRRDLVSDEKRRIEQRREDHDHTLLHAARQLHRIEIEHAVRGQTDERETAPELLVERGREAHTPATRNDLAGHAGRPCASG